MGIFSRQGKFTRINLLFRLVLHPGLWVCGGGGEGKGGPSKIDLGCFVVAALVELGGHLTVEDDEDDEDDDD